MNRFTVAELKQVRSEMTWLDVEHGWEIVRSLSPSEFALEGLQRGLTRMLGIGVF